MVGEGWLLITLTLLVISIITAQVPLLLLTTLVFLSGLLVRVWSQFALARVSHEHGLSHDHAFFGETVEVDVTVSNRKMLPLPVVQVTLEAPDELRVLRGSVTPAAGNPFRVNLTSFLAVGWYRRVTRRYQIECTKRGYYTFGPSTISVRDPFGFTSRDAAYAATRRLVVYPRVLPLRALGLPSTEILGERRVKRQLFEDPLRIVTSREYVPGDPLNRINWRSTARQGTLQTRVLESTSTPNVAVFLDVNTMESRFQAPSEPLLESAVSVAASIASHAITSRYEVGVYVNEAYRGTREMIRFAPSRNPGHLTQVLTGLAHPLGWPLHSIDRMLATEARSLPWTASILVVTAAPTPHLLGTLRRFTRAGRRVALALVGPRAAAVVPNDLPTFVIPPDALLGHAATLEVVAQ